MDAHLPIALRRTRRSTSSLSSAYASTPIPTPPSAPSTPSRRTKKRVRFSDPGPSREHVAAASTGLTPMIRRTSLRPVSISMDSPACAVSEVTFLPLRQVLDGRVKRRLRRNGLSEEMNLIYSEERTKKRARAAAAQMEVDRLRADVAAKDAEIARLRHAHVDDNENNNNDDTLATVFQDNERVMSLESELRLLRRQLNERHTEDRDAGDDRTYNWTMAARDPFASTIDDGVDGDITEAMTDAMSDIDAGDGDVFGDTTMAELQCSTPSRSKRPSVPRGSINDSQATISMGGGSFPTPPASSPTAWNTDPISPVSQTATAPTTPVTPIMRHFATARTAAATKPFFPPTPATNEMEVQASLPDPETDQLRDEVASLHRESAKLNEALVAYQSLITRVEDQLCVIESPSSPLEERVTLVLRALSDKTAALADLSKGLGAFGFPDTQDASEVVSSLAAAFRTARLELEYLTPGEIELPLSAPAARVLDLLLERLRTLSQHAREADAQIDEYHETEQALRQQLGVRVTAMDEMGGEVALLTLKVASLTGDVETLSKKVATLTEDVAERDALIGQKNALLAEKEGLLSTQSEGIADLEVGLDRLKGAMASYARDVAELEALVQRLEKELADKATEAGALKAEGEARDATHKSAVAELEAKLAGADAHAETLRKEMESMEGRVSAAEETAEAAERRADGEKEQKEDKERLLARRAAATSALNQNHGRALALRDARVHELRGEIEQVNAALRAAHDATRQLRVENAGLGAALDAEKQRAQTAVATLQAELARVGQLGKDLLGPTPTKADTANTRKRMTPGRRLLSLGRRSGSIAESAEDAEEDAGTAPEGRSIKKRRRYDSGLGFLDEEVL